MSGTVSAAGSSGVADADDSDADSTDTRGPGVGPEQSVLRHSGGNGAFDDERDDDSGRSNTFVTALKFVYQHSTALVPAGVLWVLCSLPLVTIGPASLGMYSVVLSLRDTGRVDNGRVLETVRENLVPATLLGFLPVTLAGIAALYVVSGLTTDLVGTVLAAAALYAGLYVGVLLIPTFVSMAAGVQPRTAIRESYVWLAGSPEAGLLLLLVTGVLLVATVALTVGFLLLFAALTTAYHVEALVRTADADTLPGLAATRR